MQLQPGPTVSIQVTRQLLPLLACTCAGDHHPPAAPQHQWQPDLGHWTTSSKQHGIQHNSQASRCLLQAQRRSNVYHSPLLVKAAAVSTFLAAASRAGLT